MARKATVAALRRGGTSCRHGMSSQRTPLMGRAAALTKRNTFGNSQPAGSERPSSWKPVTKTSALMMADPRRRR
ncbi:hypothetical protein ACIBF7_32055 [Nonomuraea sp. NPDC050478]|uniref:hypothetical protein n=1 Tax=Nonomuraea sp. NPDC050478 TaxID=3364365 RepID=UPI0037B480B1